MSEKDDDEPRDVNEKVIDEWIDETTPSERVRDVMKHSYLWKTVEDVAERARVDVTTAREQLHDLVEDGFVEDSTLLEQGMIYKRSPESLAAANKFINTLAGVDEYRDDLEYIGGRAYCPRDDCDWWVPRGMEYAYVGHVEEHDEDE